MRPDRKAVAKAGPCKLCGGPGPLQESHIVPKWMYRRGSRLNQGIGGTNLVQVGDGRSMLDASQLTDYLLCRKCEERFEPWEKYLSEISLQEDDRFPALEKLRPEGFTRGIAYADASELECDVLARVAVSIIWRASVSAKVQEVSLGPFEASLAQYLREDAATLPQHTRVLICLTPPLKGQGRVDRTVSHPYSRRLGMYRVHGFYTFGMWFGTCVGSLLPRELDTCCIVTGLRVIITDGSERLRGISELIAESPLKGRLAEPGRLEAFSALTRGGGA